MPSPKDAKKSRITNRLSSGIEELDHILGGGFPARRLFLIEGAPGSGKTTLALQFLLAGSKNSEKGVYVTFSESEDEVRAVAESHGWTLDGINLLELSTLGDRLKNEEQYTDFNRAM
jgi:circadian clock protein KaiC